MYTQRTYIKETRLHQEQLSEAKRTAYAPSRAAWHPLPSAPAQRQPGDNTFQITQGAGEHPAFRKETLAGLLQPTPVGAPREQQLGLTNFDFSKMTNQSCLYSCSEHH